MYQFEMAKKLKVGEHGMGLNFLACLHVRNVHNAIKRSVHTSCDYAHQKQNYVS